MLFLYVNRDNKNAITENLTYYLMIFNFLQIFFDFFIAKNWEKKETWPPSRPVAPIN